MKTTSLLLASCFTFASLATPSLAQKPEADRGEIALRYAGLLAKNRQSLMNYSWQLRIEVAKGGELQYIDLKQARYTADGRLQLSKIAQDLQVRQRHGALRARRQDKKLAEISGAVDGLRETLLGYVYMTRGNAVDFFDRAKVMPAAAYDGIVRVDGRDVLRPGDSVTLYVDSATGSPLQQVVRTPMGGGAVFAATVNFRHLRSNAAFYADQIDAQLLTEDPDDSLNIKVESFDFMKQL